MSPYGGWDPSLDGVWSRTTPSLQKELGELGLASDQDAYLMSSSGGFYQQVQLLIDPQGAEHTGDILWMDACMDEWNNG